MFYSLFKIINIRIFVIPKRTEITKGTISIPVYYNITQNDVIYWDENLEQYTDGTYTYGDIDLTDYTLKTLYVTYSGVEGGKSLGPVATIQTIPSQPNINDYFIWSGNNEEPTELTADRVFYRARLYRFNGNSENPKWETDEDISHNSAALGEIIKAANEVLNDEQLRNNNLQGWTFISSLAVCNLFVDYLVANQAIIQQLTTGVITTGSLITEAAAKNYSDEEVADSKDDLAKKLGYASYADMVAKGLDPEHYGTIITPDGYLRTNLIDTDALFAKNIKIKNGGSIESESYVDPDAILITNVYYFCIGNDHGDPYVISDYFNTFEEAEEFAETRTDVVAFSIRFSTGNKSYYMADRNIGNYFVQGQYCFKDGELAPTEWLTWTGFNIDISSHKYLFIKGSDWNFGGGDTQYKLTSQARSSDSGFVIQGNGSAKFVNATIEAADFKLQDLVAGDVVNLKFYANKSVIHKYTEYYNIDAFGKGTIRIKVNISTESGQTSVGSFIRFYKNNVMVSQVDIESTTTVVQADIQIDKNNGDIISIMADCPDDLVVSGIEYKINSIQVCLDKEVSMFTAFSSITFAEEKYDASR